VVLASVIAGASGGALANVALSPLGGGAGMIQSYWYGAGLILGERDMYTFHWEKIKKRLESGEDYLSVLESEMNPAITAIANYSLQIMKKTGDIYLKGGIDFMAQLIENLFKVLAGEQVDIIGDITVGEPTPEPEILPEVPVTDPTTISCPAGQHFDLVTQACVPDLVTTGAFIPPIYNTSNPVAIQAIGRIIALNIGFQIQAQLTSGQWTNLPDSLFPTKSEAIGTAGLYWPPPKYGPVIVGTTTFMVRLV